MTKAQLVSAAKDFVSVAFVALATDHAIPTSSYHRRLQARVDFSGNEIQSLPEYTNLEHQILTTYPEPFCDSKSDKDSKFTISLYVFRFLEECVARCSLGNNYDPSSFIIDGAIDELTTILSGTPHDFVLARHLSHLTTHSGKELHMGSVTIVPENDAIGDLEERIEQEAPCANTAWKRISPSPFRDPHSLLIVRETITAGRYRTGDDLREELDKFVLVACLLTAGTAQPTYEVAGTSTAITRIPATYQELMSDKWVSLVRRVVRLTGNELDAITGLGKMIDGADIKREGMIMTSFDAALKKFIVDDTTDPFEQLVDLATALEGVVLGGSKENEGLTVRLSSRVSALLAGDGEPAHALYNDVRHLYGLRSVIVHGGELTQKNLLKILNAISTVPPESEAHNFLVMLGHAIDRLRDILRRAILARLCLAAGPNAPWPFQGNNTPVDAILTDDHNRATWRAHWHQQLTNLNAEYAAHPAPAAVYALAPKDW